MFLNYFMISSTFKTLLMEIIFSCCTSLTDLFLSFFHICFPVFHICVFLLYFLGHFLNFIFQSFYWAMASAFMFFHFKELFFPFWILFIIVSCYCSIYAGILLGTSLVFKVSFSLHCLNFFQVSSFFLVSFLLEESLLSGNPCLSAHE